MSSVKENKAFQTIVGAGVIYIGFVLWRDGWVEWAFSSQPQEGFGNGQLLVALGAAILSFVQLVGIVTIGIVSGVLPHLDGLGDKVAELIRRGLASARGALSDYRNRDKPERSWDWKPLAAIVLAVVLLRGGVLPKIVSIVKGLISAEEVVPGKPQAVIWVMTETVTTAQMSVSVSLLVDEALASKGIERRRILSGQDLAKAEPWLRNAVSGAGGDSCLILVGSSGHELRPLPASTDDFIKEIQSW